MNNILSNMLLLATQAHHGQFDKGGKPYILHPLRVMSFLKSDDEELLAIAIGHDVIEDTKTTYKDLVDAGMTDRVIAGIQALTKQRGQSYDEYKKAVIANVDAIKVKMADLRHNSDFRRLQGVTEKDMERIAKYQKFYRELEIADGYLS